LTYSGGIKTPLYGDVKPNAADCVISLYHKIVLMILRNLLFVILISFISASCTKKETQEVKVVKFDSIKKLLKNDQNKVLLVNFWATWCAPCVKELPNFEAINKDYDNVEVVLVNLDFVQDLEKVKKFVATKELKSKIILLDEIDYDTWIDQVNPKWSGAIPATYIISARATKEKFMEGELTGEELTKTLEKFL